MPGNILQLVRTIEFRRGPSLSPKNNTSSDDPEREGNDALYLLEQHSLCHWDTCEITDSWHQFSSSKENACLDTYWPCSSGVTAKYVFFLDSYTMLWCESVGVQLVPSCLELVSGGRQFWPLHLPFETKVLNVISMIWLLSPFSILASSWTGQKKFACKIKADSISLLLRFFLFRLPRDWLKAHDQQ